MRKEHKTILVSNPADRTSFFVRKQSDQKDIPAPVARTDFKRLSAEQQKKLIEDLNQRADFAFRQAVKSERDIKPCSKRY
jgi:hypothetical protein